MLLQFTVENYLSFNKATTFSMRAGRDKDHSAHVIGGKFPALKAGVIYGANAAGKSNLVAAMAFARDFIVRGRRLNEPVATQPFGAATESKHPSGFHWVFCHEGKLWSYGFDVTNSRIIEEYLIAQSETGGKEQVWFERKLDKNGNARITFGATLRGRAKSKLSQRLDLIVENLRDEQPFLTHAVENKIEELKPVYNWFAQILLIIGAETEYEPLIAASHSSKEFLQFLSEFVRLADTGINRLIPVEEKVEWGKNISGLSSEDQANIEANISKGQAVMVHGEQVAKGGGRRQIMIIRRDEKTGDLHMLTLAAEHIIDGKPHVFPLIWESDGTQRMLNILPLLLHYQTRPTVLVMDEIDRRLHTKLTRRFIEMVLSCETANGNQLVVTTHDTNLLDSALLRRDEIWFARKENNQTYLERLSQYDIRSDRDYEKAYELGRVGGGGPNLSYELFRLADQNENSTVKEVIAHAAS